MVRLLPYKFKYKLLKEYCQIYCFQTIFLKVEKRMLPSKVKEVYSCISLLQVGDCSSQMSADWSSPVRHLLEELLGWTDSFQ